MWYAFEISLDNGSTWTKNDLFYKLYYTDSYNDNNAVTDSSVTGSLATDGYTAVQTTNYINQEQSNNKDYIYLSTRALSGSIMKIRYKVTYSADELASTDWIVFGNYNKTVEQRTTNCDPVITTTGWGTATTTTSTNDTYSGLVTIDLQLQHLLSQDLLVRSIICTLQKRRMVEVTGLILRLILQ